MRPKRLGLIGAMEEEVRLLLEEMKEKTESVRAGIRFYEGMVQGHKAVVCTTGVGKVNAAVTTQILIDRFGVDAVLFTGVAGALHPELEIGDLVISSDCIQHDMDASPLGYSPGMIPYQDNSVFAADRALIALAEAACRDSGVHAVTGRVLSGDRFIADRKEAAALREQFAGCCAEMEGASVAQVCSMNEVPFLILRSMSDQADGSAEMSYREFTELASRRSHEILMYILKRLPDLSGTDTF
ncbi:5'-methylthioadenosine/adenosylhomocysteine nucleosidase [Paenibacillus glufosinatiresistens]|uniref:5'-methylthioadenosine/adenosylhomocysteine nucleosidase n=1 Tax=Paenibacillus glufosinatiresistens TaxID=3070657 RepID=UPI00286E88E4|nr:5'-methylthioadenosine/adenosylhomocysteine nucleosidase [Paenibacillus sp. YX.27]